MVKSTGKLDRTNPPQPTKSCPRVPITMEKAIVQHTTPVMVYRKGHRPHALEVRELPRGLDDHGKSGYESFPYISPYKKRGGPARGPNSQWLHVECYRDWLKWVELVVFCSSSLPFSPHLCCSCCTPTETTQSTSWNARRRVPLQEPAGKQT